MLRLIALTAVMAAALLSLPGCDDGSSQGNTDFQADVDKGRRPEPTAQRDAPGPGKGSAGFQQGDPGQLPAGQTPPPPPPPPKKGG